MLVVEVSLAWKRLQEHWPLKYRTELGDCELTDELKYSAESLTSRYYKEICKEFYRRFSEPSILPSQDKQQRKQYGENKILRLWVEYGPLLQLLVLAYQINAEWPFREKLVPEFNDSRTAADVSQGMIQCPPYSCFPTDIPSTRSHLLFPCQQPGQAH